MTPTIDNNTLTKRPRTLFRQTAETDPIRNNAELHQAIEWLLQLDKIPERLRTAVDNQWHDLITRAIRRARILHSEPLTNDERRNLRRRINPTYGRK